MKINHSQNINFSSAYFLNDKATRKTVHAFIKSNKDKPVLREAVQILSEATDRIGKGNICIKMNLDGADIGEISSFKENSRTPIYTGALYKKGGNYEKSINSWVKETLKNYIHPKKKQPLKNPESKKPDKIIYL